MNFKIYNVNKLVDLQICFQSAHSKLEHDYNVYIQCIIY